MNFTYVRYELPSSLVRQRQRLPRAMVVRCSTTYQQDSYLIGRQTTNSLLTAAHLQTADGRRPLVAGR